MQQSRLAEPLLKRHRVLVSLLERRKVLLPENEVQDVRDAWSKHRHAGKMYENYDLVISIQRI
jgi:hypothetical protein